jgi:hypothetical protein
MKASKILCWLKKQRKLNLTDRQIEVKFDKLIKKRNDKKSRTVRMSNLS